MFTREIERLVRLLLIIFILVGFTAAYWAIWGPDQLLPREDNPRLVLAEARIQRGNIYDRNGTLLVRSVSDKSGFISREYLYEAFYSALGYYSLRHGVGGAEAAYNEILRGDDLPVDYFRQLLHYPRQGSDIQLTFDLDIQQTLAQLMRGHTGAAVVMRVPDGAVLGLISAPTYNPNLLDEQWDELRNAPDDPIFNRPLQGQYQPGGMLQLPLVAAALLTGQSVDALYDNGTQAVIVDNLVVGCIQRPERTDISLYEAFLYGCPFPFVQAGQAIGQERISRIFETFSLNTPVSIPGFVPEELDGETEPTPESTPEITTSFEEFLLGQGNLTVNPFNIALILAATINHGDAPQPYALLASKPPFDDSWSIVDNKRPTLAFMTEELAHQLKAFLQSNIQQGAAQIAYHEGWDMGGYVARAFSGEGAESWFAGYISSDNGENSVVVVIVLEDIDNPQLAAQLGGDLLAHIAQNGSLLKKHITPYYKSYILQEFGAKYH